MLHLTRALCPLHEQTYEAIRQQSGRYFSSSFDTKWTLYRSMQLPPDGTFKGSLQIAFDDLLGHVGEPTVPRAGQNAKGLWQPAVPGLLPDAHR